MSMKLRKGFHAASEEERKTLRIPPMYVDAQAADDKSAKLQGLAKSPNTGKTLYFYSDAWKASASAEKFVRVAKLMRDVAKLTEKVEADCKQGVSEAMCLRLILMTGMRNGNPSQAVVKAADSVGASTLLMSQCRVDSKKNALVLDFTGKSGVQQHYEVEDHTLLLWAANRVAAGETRLFDHDAKDTLAYLRSFDETLKVHDLRTWYANVLAQAYHAQLRSALTGKKLKKAIAKAVAEKLGNTPSAAEKSYVDPALFAEEV